MERLSVWVFPCYPAFQGKQHQNVDRQTSTNATTYIGPKEDNTGLAPALSPGVANSLGEGFDPSFITAENKNGEPLYLTADVDFGINVYLRASTDLNDIYRNKTKQHLIYSFPPSEYPEGVGTEAADIARWDKLYIYTVSAIVDDTIRVLMSETDDPLGGYTDFGRIVDGNQAPIKGYDPHLIAHPNGKKYLTYSNHQYVQMVELISPNQTYGQPVNLISYGVNTEAPSSWIYPNLVTGSMTLNLAYAEGNYYQSNYNTRVIYIDIADDPLDPTKWFQRGEPMLSSDSSQRVYGPGSGGFFRGPDGHVWFAYGAFMSRDGANNGKNDRFIRAQVAAADERGVLLPTQVVNTTLAY